MCELVYILASLSSKKVRRQELEGRLINKKIISKEGLAYDECYQNMFRGILIEKKSIIANNGDEW